MQGAKGEAPRKLFVGCLTEAITKEDIFAYFANFGVVTDVFIPSPFRGIAFVTFAEGSAAQAALEAPNHLLNGTQINVSTPQPRKPPPSGAATSSSPYSSQSQMASSQAASAQAQAAAMNAMTSQALLQQLALNQFGGLAGLQAAAGLPAGLSATGIPTAAGLGATALPAASLGAAGVGSAATTAQGLDASASALGYAGQTAQQPFKW